MGHVARRFALVPLAACLLACGAREELPATLEVERVVARLDAAHFPGLVTSFHGGVATIGDESRPVVREPELRPAVTVLGVPVVDGVARAEVVLPAGLAGRTAGELSLRVQGFPAAMPPSAWDKIARDHPSKRISSAWSLEREDAPHGVLRYAPTDEGDGPLRYHLHLDALEAGPARLDSRPFDVPDGARLELAFGVTTKTDGPGYTPVRFHAVLACDALPERPLVDDAVDAGLAPGWREAAFDLASGARDCRLTLDAAHVDGRPAPGAVWAVPRVVVRDSVAGGREAHNLVLISLDTLRADHLSGYGYARATSPEIDAKLIARGTLFADVSTTYSRTDVSHMSLFSGLYPPARRDPRRLSHDTPMPMLAERLRDAGFATAAFTEDGLLAGLSGFWFGFDRFTERTFQAEARGRATFEGGKEWLRENRDRRFFLFLHTYKTHAPYVSSNAYQGLFTDAAAWEHPELQRDIGEQHRATADAYDRTIREADALVGELLREIAAQGLAERTLVVLTSDHGESLGEHGPPGHNYSPNQEVVHVPLVFRGPGVPAGRVVPEPVSLVDLAPTLLDLLGVPPLDATQGISLAPALRGEALPARPLFFAWLTPDSKGLRNGRWKYLQSGSRRELFDLENDPRERTNLTSADERNDLARQILERHAVEASEIRSRLTPASGPDTPAPVTTEDVERSLRALGYIE